MNFHHLMVAKHNQTKMLSVAFQVKIDSTAETFFFAVLNLLDIGIVSL